MSKKAFDLFCGAGGSSFGAKLAGVQSIGALDKWNVASNTFAANFPDARVYQRAAAGVDPTHLKKDIGKIDLLMASPECTNHSVAKGAHRRCNRSKNTAFEVVRFAEVFKPRYLAVENVIQMRDWHRFEEWWNALEGLGYHLRSGVIDAQFHSTPQSRRRLFVVGDRVKEPVLPKSHRKTTKTVRNILGKGENRTSPWEFRPLNSKKRAKATLLRARRAIRIVGKDKPFIMVYYGSDGAGGFQRLDRPLRTITTLDRFAYVRKREGRYEMRMLQPEELAAAMGFPKSYKWEDTSRREKIKLIGNAVCPLVMRDVIKSLIS